MNATGKLIETSARPGPAASACATVAGFGTSDPRAFPEPSVPAGLGSSAVEFAVASSPRPGDHAGPSSGGIALREAIATQWATGGFVVPNLRPASGKSKLPGFESAAFVAVTISLAWLPVHTILHSPYTARYCSVAAFPASISGDGVCVLAFELPALETDASRYALLQAGLEARYSGSKVSSGAAQAYYAGISPSVQIVGRALDAPAVRELIQLGRESKEIRRQPDDLLRSRVPLEIDTVIRTWHREEVSLGELHPDVKVFCPIHTDAEPTALSFRLTDGRPVLACAHCQRTYSVRDASNDYDFGTFDRTVRALASAESASAAEAGTEATEAVSVAARAAEAGAATAEELAEEAGAAASEAAASRQFEVRNERYLGHVPLRPGVLCVKSPKGSGKTEQLVSLVRQCRSAKKRVLLIGHRRTLLMTMAKRLRLTCYLAPELPAVFRQAILEQIAEASGQEGEREAIDGAGDADTDALHRLGGYRQCSPTSRFAISLDSLMVLRPDVNKYHVVIIDEAEQVFSHLVGSTLREKRQEVYHRLRHYLRVAESVVLMDADLGMVTMDSLFAMGLMPDVSISFILNVCSQNPGTARMYDSQGQLVDRLRVAVGAGEKCYVATNSKNKAIELQKALSKDWPERRIVVVHSDNSTSIDVQHLLSNIADEFERNIDVLIASPALGTGVDITFKLPPPRKGMRTVVQHVFGLFMGRITTHLDMDQQLMRVRHPGAVHVWVDPVEDYFETDVGVIKDQLSVTVGETRTLLGYDDDGQPKLAAEDGLIDIWSRVRAANRGSKNRLATLFRQLRADAGWRIEDVARETESAKAGTESMKEGKELRVEERAARIMAAPVLDDEAAEKLKWRHKQSLPMSVAERAALERHWLEAFYCEKVSEKLIDLDCDGRLRSAIDNLECLLAPDVANREFDKSQRDNKVWAADLGVRCARASLLREVLQAAGLFDAKNLKILDSAEVEQSTLESFVGALRKRKQQFESAFDLLPRKDADSNRVQQLGVVLEKMGLRLDKAKASDVGGKKVRRYSLDLARLARLRQIMSQRTARSTSTADCDRGRAGCDGLDADTMRRIKALVGLNFASVGAISGDGATTLGSQE